MHRKGSRDRNRQPTEWEERLASDTTGRGSASTLHTRLLELSVRAASSHKNGQEVYADVSPTKTGRQTGKRHRGELLGITAIRDASQSCREASPHTRQDGRHQEVQKR